MWKSSFRSQFKNGTAGCWSHDQVTLVSSDLHLCCEGPESTGGDFIMLLQNHQLKNVSAEAL